MGKVEQEERRSISLLEATYDDGTVRISGKGPGTNYKVIINEEELTDVTGLTISFSPRSVPMMTITRFINPDSGGRET